MGINDTIRDGYNWLLGGFTNHGQEGFILRGRLVDLSNEGRPYATAALAKIDELSRDGFDPATERKIVLDTFMTGMRASLARQTDPTKRFDEFKSAMDKLTNGASTPGLNAFSEAPPQVRDALMNAITHNPNFLEHLSKNGTGSIASLLTPEVLKNTTYSGPIADILNSIANNPNYDLTRLDNVGAAAKTYFDAEKALADASKPGQPALDEQRRKLMTDKIEESRRALLTSVREAGGNVPAMANFNMGMLTQFLKDLFNGDLNLAIGNLANGLGLQGQQLTDFRGLMEPIAGFTKFMGQDYYDYFSHYGPQFMESGTRTWNTIDGLMNGQRVQFQRPADGTETTRRVGEDRGNLAATQRDAAAGVTPADNSTVVQQPAYRITSGMDMTYSP